MKNIPLKAVIFIALVIWTVFYPAFMNADSIVQYIQAFNGTYDDWHPPVMAIILHYILKAGGGVGTVTLIQTILGCVGIYLLSQTILLQFNISGRTYTFFPLILLLFLFTPLTPLPFYLMYFSKDTWVALGLIWIALLTLKLYEIKRKAEEGKGQPKIYFLYYLMLFLFMLMILLVRHNALVLIPVFICILYVVSGKALTSVRFRFLNLIPGLVLIGMYWGSSYGIYKVYQVKETHAENQIFAMESLGVLVKNIDNKKYLPYTFSHLTPIYKTAYIPGNVTPVMWYGPIKAVDSSFDENNPLVKEQYFDLLKHSPLSVIKVKWDGFANMIFPLSKYTYLCHTQIDKNDYGLLLNTRFEDFRNSWINALLNVQKNIITRCFFDEHLVWIVVNLALLLGLYFKKILSVPVASILILSLAYYLSYLIATANNDYRYMFPSTLLMQVVAISLAFIYVRIKKADRKQERRAA